MRTILLGLAVGIALLITGFTSVAAVTPEELQLQNQINEYTAKLNETKNRAASLANQIVYMDSQIKLTTLKITDTKYKIVGLEKEIDDLKLKIGDLEQSLTKVSEVMIDRIVATYKSNMVNPMTLLLSSDGFPDLLSRAKYLRLVQTHDKKLMFAIQATKSDFEEQKKLLENKKKELDELKKKLEAQTITLSQQKKDKEYLLKITRNDEKRYQELLAQAKAEYEAIQAIIAGKGKETEVGKVKEGDKIAGIIQGPSCNSKGAHIHFMVTKQDKTTDNPFNYLKNGVDYENCSGAGDCNPADSFNPSGSWNWPINQKIRFAQGYGYTWAVQNDPFIRQIYNFHNGIDINSLSSTEVKAVKSGTLYRGSYDVGCALRYVRVDHDDSDLNTFYLHVNY